MPYRSAFSSNTQAPVPRTTVVPSKEALDLRGLDLTSPYDNVRNGRSPFARNFRMYAQESGDRRVAISSRKGSGRYLDPVGETLAGSDTSTTGATNGTMTNTTRLAMKYIPSATGPLTKVELLLGSNSASGPLVVEIYTNSSGVPGTKLADSGILGADIPSTPGYVPARFVEAPSVTNGTTYWIVAYMQDDAVGSYAWRTNTSSTNALRSTTSGLSWSAQLYSLAFKGYVSSANKILGLTRYTPETSSNSTLFASGTAVYKGDDVTRASSTIATGLSASATDYYFAEMDGKKFWVNGYDDLKYYNGITTTTITHSNLPILKYIVAHKNRIFGVSASDPNKLIFSELPGNDDGAGKFWYEAYLSTSFIYVPSPKAQDPIVGLLPFQNGLIIFTRSSKYVLSGDDPGSFTLREATGKQGAVSQRAMLADENYMYFAAPDGLYRSNGSSDDKISDIKVSEQGSYGVQPEYESITTKEKIAVAKWKGLIRFYYPSQNQAVNDRCLIWHPVFQEWFLDTGAYGSHVVTLTDGNDPNALIEANSNAPFVTYAEQDNNILGKAIDFIYHCNYDSFGNPAQRKRIPKFYPLLEGDGGNFNVTVGVDKDRNNSPTETTFPMSVSGAKWGNFNYGDGTLYGISNSFKPVRVKVSGYGYYWQVRVSRKGINNKVRFIGYVLSMRGKRL